jgi:hypothetical protein
MTLNLPQRSVARRALNRLMRWARPKGIGYNPYDRTTRERLASMLFEKGLQAHPLGTLARGRTILDIVEESCLTEPLASAYFENLDLYLKTQQPRAHRGQVVLGLGTGRNGSTSLAVLLQSIDGSCSTHENPPLVSWEPQQSELDFHFRRFERLTDYFPLVADVAHWWLNSFDEFLKRFPDGKAIGLIRSTDACVDSFMRIKGSGFNSYNHWAPYGNGLWAAAQWDPTYPTYLVPDDAQRDPDASKRRLIERYVREYNDRLRKFAKLWPETILLVRTEELSDSAIQNRIFDFVGLQGHIMQTTLNASTVLEGRMAALKF